MKYWDNGASTKIDETVNKLMFEKSKEIFGNPSSKYHEQGRNAKRLLDESRKWFTDFFNVDNENIIFTSGATESNNMIVKGIALNNINQNKNIVISKLEHPSIQNQEEFLNKLGIEVRYFDHDKNGQINSYSQIDENTVLVCINVVNHDLGIIQKDETLENLFSHISNDIPIHLDCVKLFGKSYFSDVLLNRATSISISGHKINGPKGIGILMTKNDGLVPLFHGGEQEFSKRAGTENIISIYGFYLASKYRYDNLSQYLNNLKDETNKAIVDINEMFGEYVEYLNYENQVIGHINIFIKDNLNTTILDHLSEKIMMSNGSACSITKPSESLLGLGFSRSKISEFIRITL